MAAEPQQSGPIVATDHLSKWYGQVIGLNDVTLTVGAGRHRSSGPNGAGKSTLLKLVTGQLKPSKGSLSVLGETVWGTPASSSAWASAPSRMPSTTG